MQKPMQRGRESVYQRKKSGNWQPKAQMEEPGLGVIYMIQIRRTWILKRQHLLAVTRKGPAPMERWTWQEMYGNGPIQSSPMGFIIGAGYAVVVIILQRAVAGTSREVLSQTTSD